MRSATEFDTADSQSRNSGADDFVMIEIIHIIVRNHYWKRYLAGHKPANPAIFDCLSTELPIYHAPHSNIQPKYISTVVKKPNASKVD